jgi:5-methylcytosine-specific restriction endonuclease McrA
MLTLSSHAQYRHVEGDPHRQRRQGPISRSKRTAANSCALNGYQMGRCFYCRRDIEAGHADVDHFLPHTLLSFDLAANVDGIWNLVLACADCNRGPNGKFARVPELRFLERLHNRNEFLIESHRPLRETLISQTGGTEADRRSYLQQAWSYALSILVHTWHPAETEEPIAQ